MVIPLIFLMLLIMNTLLPQQSLRSLTQENPFKHNLDVKIITSKNKSDQITICCHGYGHNNQIADVINSFRVISGTLLGFNFPDYNITPATDHTKAAYGTIQEILPLLYLLKRCIHDLRINKIDLYGFSAGGAAIINALAALNQTRFDKELLTVGITPSIKKEIIAALEKSIIILDCPLKSCEEIIACRGANKEVEILATHYKKNNMRPIDSLKQLEGMNLTLLVHFQKPDEVLGNRDDALFIEQLKKANTGTTKAIVDFDGGHNTMHKGLWTEYKKIQTIS